MGIAHAACVAHAIEELKYLHGALAAEADAVAEAGGAHAAVLARAGIDDSRQLRDTLAGIEEIAYHLVDTPVRHLLAQHGAHALFALVQCGSEVPHPGRIEASCDEQRL
ncbi:MAG TPA: hypothetical protein VGH61_11155 [Steroidobacteraceae bacterium]